MRYAKGIMWLDDCRIPFVDEGDKQQGKVHYAGATGNGVYSWNKELKESGKEYNITQGRFTPNLLVCDDVLNDGVISKTNTRGQTRSQKRTLNYFVVANETEMSVIQDKGTNSRYYDLDKWFNQMIGKL